jgi:hypothetical protein
LFATGLTAGSSLTDVVTIGNHARVGGGLFLSDGELRLHDATLVGDAVDETGGALHATRMSLDVQRLDVADPSAAGNGAAALRLDGTSGTLTDVVVLGGTASSSFTGTGSLVHVGAGSDTLAFERWVLHSGQATHGVWFEDISGAVTVHDLELGFFEGRYGIRGDNSVVDATLRLDNVWVHNVTGSGCHALQLYPVFLSSPWALRHATLSNNSCEIELAVYAWYSPLVVRDVLAGSVRGLGDTSIAWLDPAGELDIAHVHALEGLLWRNGVNSGDPRVVPSPCPGCTSESGSPFLAPLPSYDVRLDPASPLVGSGDASDCTASSPATCADPGFWGGPNPPAPR